MARSTSTVDSPAANEDTIRELRDLMRWARQHFGVRAAAVTLNDRDSVGILAMDGADDDPAPCETSLRAAAHDHHHPFHAEDTPLYPTAPPDGEALTVCAGVPFVSPSGEAVGGVYVLDNEPHHFDVIEMIVLKRLADLVKLRMQAAGIQRLAG
jgi:hypothetical protein